MERRSSPVAEEDTDSLEDNDTGTHTEQACNSLEVEAGSFPVADTLAAADWGRSVDTSPEFPALPRRVEVGNVGSILQVGEVAEPEPLALLPPL